MFFKIKPGLQEDHIDSENDFFQKAISAVITLGNNWSSNPPKTLGNKQELARLVYQLLDVYISFSIAH